MADFINTPLPPKMQSLNREVERLRDYIELFRKDLAHRKTSQPISYCDKEPVVVVKKVTFGENKLGQSCAKVELFDGSSMIFDEYKTQNGYRYVERGYGTSFEICEGGEL